MSDAASGLHLLRPSKVTKTDDPKNPFVATVTWPDIALVIDRSRLAVSTRALEMIDVLINAGYVREWRQVIGRRPGPMEFVWTPYVAGTDDYGSVRYSVTGRSVATAGVSHAHHNAVAAVSWAKHRGFSSRGLFNQAQAYEASQRLPETYFITSEPHRLTAGGPKLFSAISPEQALAIIGLHQRVSGNVHLPLVDELLSVHTDDAYRIGAVHLTRGVWDIHRHRPAGSLHPVESDSHGPRWPVLLAGITERIEEALECRDALRLRDLGYRSTSRSPSTLLTQLTLALAGALDSLARAVNEAAQIGQDPRRVNWGDKSFRHEVRNTWPETARVWVEDPTVLPAITFTHQIRNSIHSDPLARITRSHWTLRGKPEDQLMLWPEYQKRVREHVAQLHRKHWIHPDERLLSLRPSVIADELPGLVAQVIQKIVVSSPWPTEKHEETQPEHPIWSAETGERTALMMGFGDVWRRVFA